MHERGDWQNGAVAQQVWWPVPHATQVPAVQLGPLHGVAPGWHGAPLEHIDCPGPPQAMQVPAVQPGPLHGIANGWHAGPVAHVSVPGRPQLTQVPAVQLASRHGVAHCWHVLPGQTGCPGAPHAWQVPALHRKPVPHAGPLVQQTWFAPPHATHVPGKQLELAHGVAPALHGGVVLHSSCPGAPHATHLLALQTPPLHAGCGNGQQSCDGPPHATQLPALHDAPVLQAWPVPQHA